MYYCGPKNAVSSDIFVILHNERGEEEHEN